MNILEDSLVQYAELPVVEVSFGDTERKVEQFEPEHWSEKYLTDRYNWEESELPYVVVPLSRGYFAIVELADAKRVSRYSWQVNVQYRTDGHINAVYAYRRATARELALGAPQRIYLHRFLTDTMYAGRHVVVDHRTGEGLDNRRANLKCTDSSGNQGNVRVVRTVNSNLQRGVEPISNTRKDGTRHVTGYKGRIRIPGMKGEVQCNTRRSKTVFRSPERAHRWYLRMHEKLHHVRDSWSSEAAITPPIFPLEWQTKANQPEVIPF